MAANTYFLYLFILNKKMTRGRSIKGIFHQNVPFSKTLVIWGAKIKALVVRRAIRKTTGNLGG